MTSRTDFLLTPWLLHEEEPGCILADAGDDGRPSVVQVDIDRDHLDPVVSDIAEHVVNLHNASRTQAIHVCDGCGRFAIDPVVDLAQIRMLGGLSCCPERKMVRKTLAGIGALFSAYRRSQDVIRERAYVLAYTTLKPGDKIRVQRCGNIRGAVFTFAGWDGYWAVSKSGIKDLSPACILTVNGQWVDWSMSLEMWTRSGPGEPGWKKAARKAAEHAIQDMPF